ncbi:MAG: glycosyltransferase family 2 protein [Rhodothermales bacterium]
MRPWDRGLTSVILPAYNAAPYIREALQSVFDQTYPSFEIIVVDDGSTDGTAEIVREYAAADTRVTLVRQSNQGVGAARNTAIRHARGIYIAPLDADDRWAPDKLQKQVARMVAMGASAGLIYCWYRSINGDGNVLGYSDRHTVEGRAPRAMLLRNLTGNASVPLFRATTLKALGGYLTRAEQGGGQGFEDWDLSLRVSERFDVGVVPDHLVDYRQAPHCMSTNARSMSRSLAVVMDEARRRNPGIAPREFRWSKGNFYYYVTRRAFRWSKNSVDVRSLALAVVADPIYLLNLQTYRMVGRSVVYWLTGGRIFCTRGRKVEAYPREGHGPAPRKNEPSEEENASSVGQRLFGRIQSKRWSAVLLESAPEGV